MSTMVMAEKLKTCVILFFLSIGLTSAWDPDAGLVTSLTKSTAARVLASSAQDQARKADDGEDSTHWTSAGCLPGAFYISNPLTNVLYNACQQGRCRSSSQDAGDMAQATDPSVYTGYQVRGREGEQASITITLQTLDNLRHVTVRGTFHLPTQLVLMNDTTEKVAGTLTSSNNYQTRDFNVTLTPTTSLTLRSWGDFTLYVVGAIGQRGCVERLYVDMGTSQHVRVIRTRHWAGQHGLTSQLVASQDGMTWQRLRDLDPNALQAVVTILDSSKVFRYVGVEHRHDEANYAKVYVWEIDAYGESGMYGGAPSPRSNFVNLRDMMGVNGIWGWGWGKSSERLSAGQGAALYAPVASYARNYHNLNWDVRDPDNDPDFSRMAQGQGTDAKGWLNWDTEYGQWVADNVTVHVSVQFTAQAFPVSVWNDSYHAAYQYGQAFAQHFGPTHGNGLVRSAEVGNEPWDYPAPFYTTVLDGMASGFKAGDPHMVVMPGAFQAHDATSTGNYIGTRVTQPLASTIDVVNFHHYSWRHRSDGSRHATYPEDLAGSFNEIHSIIRWRDTNSPRKPLWVTEWGWDSPGGGQDCSKFPECTTEAAASAYAARGLLLHARLNVARSTWFFCGNLDDCDSHVFCRSGLTSSKSANFVKKGPYHTLENLLHLMGHTHFLNVIQEDDKAYVYEFGTLHPSCGPPTPTHIVAWRPVDASHAAGTREVTVTFTYSSQPAHAWRLSASQQQSGTSLPSTDGTRWTMAISAMPTVVQIVHSDLIG